MTMAESATKGKAQNTVNREAGRGDVGLPPLRVRYYRRMKPARVHTVEVLWRKSAKPQRGEVTVRLRAAGAQVLPSEQTMNAAEPDKKTIFYVTPLVKGWLRNQKLEVFSQGRKVQEIPMTTRVVSQRFTWFLLLCTLFVPWFLAEVVKLYPPAEAARGRDDRIVYRHIAKEVEAYIKDSVPALPGFLKGTPVETGLLEARSLAGKGYQSLVEVSRLEPIAFYAGAVLLGLTLISAYMHKPKRRKVTGKPIAVVAP
jgi:hypothetical protein